MAIPNFACALMISTIVELSFGADYMETKRNFKNKKTLFPNLKIKTHSIQLISLKHVRGVRSSSFVQPKVCKLFLTDLYQVNRIT